MTIADVRVKAAGPMLTSTDAAGAIEGGMRGLVQLQSKIREEPAYE